MFEKIKKNHRRYTEFDAEMIRAEKKRIRQESRRAAREAKLIGTAYDPAAEVTEAV